MALIRVVSRIELENQYPYVERVMPRTVRDREDLYVLDATEKELDTYNIRCRYVCREAHENPDMDW